jgi:hypothetical protein
MERGLGFHRGLKGGRGRTHALGMGTQVGISVGKEKGARLLRCFPWEKTTRTRRS